MPHALIPVGIAGRLLRPFGVLGLAFALLLTGCTQQRGVDDWQQAAEAYVTEQANHDLLALTERQEHNGHRVFKTLGHESPEQGADAVGLFVGQHQVHDRPTLVFLVGLVEDRTLRQAQVVAASQQDGRIDWHVGEPVESATQTYRRHHHVRHGTSRHYTGWPQPFDRYELRAAGSTLYVVETNTQATWFVHLD